MNVAHSNNTHKKYVEQIKDKEARFVHDDLENQNFWTLYGVGGDGYDLDPPPSSPNSHNII